MATSRTRKSREPSNEGPLGDLNRFLTGFVQLTAEISKGMLAQSNDADERDVIAAYAEPLNAQVFQLAEFIMERAKGYSRQETADIESILKLNGAGALVESGKRLAKNVASTTAKIGLSDIFDLIKKILRKLFKLPGWLDAILELINEIKNFLMSTGSTRLANTLSRRHQDYMAELAHLERLERESAWRFKNSNEDEDEE